MSHCRLRRPTERFEMQARTTFAALLVAALGLPGCGGLPGNDPVTNDATIRCSKYYFKIGTPAMARCVEREARSGRTGTGDTGVADKALVKCVGYGYQIGSDAGARCVQREVNEPGAGPRDADD